LNVIYAGGLEQADSPTEGAEMLVTEAIGRTLATMESAPTSSRWWAACPAYVIGGV
jgi:hypothetical protein